MRRREPLTVSCVTLLEIAMLSRGPSPRIKVPIAEFLAQFEENPVYEILPLDIAVATEVAALGDSLRDPMDRTIVCTARVHNLRLVTSDQRIIDSKLVPVVT